MDESIKEPRETDGKIQQDGGLLPEAESEKQGFLSFDSFGSSDSSDSSDSFDSSDSYASPVSSSSSSSSSKTVKTSPFSYAAAKLKAFFGKVLRQKYLFLCFLCPAAIMLLIYFFMDVYPFGENSVLVLDLNGQYVYFFEALRKIITEGHSMLYSFSRALGGEFMGIYAYYLASPLSLIVALFPKENITEALLVMILLKCGLCGATFGLYVHKTRPRRPVQTVMFSCMYALCSFAVVMQHNVMWTDNLILLPIVMLGIEKMIKKGSLPLFVISLSLAVLSNFYIGYMMCIFSAVYFFYFYFSRSRGEINPCGVKFHFLKSFSRMALCAISTVCICAVIILPTYYSLSFGKTDFSNPSWIFTQKFDFADMISKLFYGSYDTVRPEGLPFLYTGTLTLILFPLYFVSPKIQLREKISSLLLLAFFVLSMDGSVIDLVWHGFQKPNWLNYRYSFILCFFILLFAYRALEDLRDIGFRRTAVSSGVIFGALIILQKLDLKNMPDLSCIWASIGFCAVYLLVLKAVVSQSDGVRQTALICISIIMCFELFSSGLLNLYALDRDVLFSNRTGYRTFIDSVGEVADDIKESDQSFYRTEKTTHRKTNDNFALGIYGLSSSTSTLNASTIKFLGRMGFASKSHWSKYLGETPVSDSLLGVKYVISRTDSGTPYLYEKVKEYPETSLEYSKNPYALPIAYGVSERYLNCSFTDDTALPSPFQKMNSLVRCMMGETDFDGASGVYENVFENIAYSDYSTTNLSETYTSSHIKFEKVDDSLSAAVTFYVKALYDGPLYCYFPSKYTREANLYVNGDNAGTYFGNETYRIVNLGEMKAGEMASVRLELTKTELYILDMPEYFWQLDTEGFLGAVSRLSKSPFIVTSHTEDTLSGTIDVSPECRRIFTSIPYDAAWQVTCDGERVETSEAIDALLTFELPEGEHELRLEYRPVCVTAGAAVSAVGVVSFTLICIGNSMMKKRDKNRQNNESNESNI